MKFERRTRNPATDDSTMMRPCPCCRNRPATADNAAAGQVRLTVIMRAIRPGSDFVHRLEPELPHGDHDEIDRLGCLLEALHHGLVDVAEHAGVEHHGSDPGHAVTKVLCRLLERHAVAPGEDDRSAAVLHEQSDKFASDVRRPAEHNDRLGVTECVVHHTIPSLRDRSEASTPSGSTLRRTLRMASSCGYMTERSSGRRRESLAR